MALIISAVGQGVSVGIAAVGQSVGSGGCVSAGASGCDGTSVAAGNISAICVGVAGCEVGVGRIKKKYPATTNKHKQTRVTQPIPTGSNHFTGLLGFAGLG